MIGSQGRIAALMMLTKGSSATLTLKRLALLFDEVLYLLPGCPPVITETLQGKTLDQTSFAQKLPDGSIDVSAFNYFRDTSRPFEFTEDSLDSELRHTLSVFKESGIARPLESRCHGITAEEFSEIRDRLAARDARDEEFIRISETAPSEYQLFETLKTITLSGEGGQFSFDTIDPPTAISDSNELSEILVLAHEAGCCPIFSNARQRRELEYRYAQFLDSEAELSLKFPQLGRSLGMMSRFGEVAYSISNSIFDSEVLRVKTPEEIVKYRDALSDARRRYVSGDLIEVTQLVDSNPWSEKTREEVRRYIAGRLNQDVAKYDAQSRAVWEKLYGSIVVRLSEGAKSTVLGGTAGGLVGTVLPHASTWEIVMIGAIAGLANEAPKLVQSLVESILEARKLKRNSIAYVRHFA